MTANNNSNNDERFPPDRGTPSTGLALAPLIHEQQSLQLCAVHAVNNLLQLSSPPSDTANTTPNSTSSETNNNAASLASPSFGRRKDRRSNSSGNEERQSVVLYQCSGSITIRRTSSQVQPATKPEFDKLADELTLMESRLLSTTSGLDGDGDGVSVGDGDDDGESDEGGGGCLSPSFRSRARTKRQHQQSQQPKPTMRERMASNHRTLYFGNYSFECMELCLKNRGVALDWYRLSEPSEAVNDNNGDGNQMGEREGNNKPMGKRGDAADTEINTKISSDQQSFNLEKDTSSAQIVIGFIINLPDDDTIPPTYNPINLTLWGASKILSYVPLVGGLFEGGRHWYAVTGLRRISDVEANTQDDDDDANTPTTASLSPDQNNCWYVIDSDQAEVAPLKSDADLVEYLRSVQDRGGQIFRATAER